MGEVEKSGVPTVTLVNRVFEREFKVCSKTWGTPGLPYAVATDRQISLLMTESEIQQCADSIGTDVLVDALTKAPSEEEAYRTDTVSLASVLLGQEVPELETFEGTDRLVAWENMNATFLDRQWGDGFPLVAPTPEKVAQMLKCTHRSPKDVIGLLAPGWGIATVQKIGINAVMAGCKPEQLPVLIAAVDAITDPGFQLRNVCTSTTAFTPMLIVNGPIRARIGMNSGECCLGPGAPSAVNTAIGRAMRLILMNIAGNYVGVTDPDSIGSPNKYSMCLAENEEANPWAPLHVERGYAPNQSTAIVVCAASLMEWNDQQAADPVDLLRKLALVVCSPAGTNSWAWVGRAFSDDKSRDPVAYPNDCLILMLPNHARFLAQAGWDKVGTKEVLHLFARRNIADRPGSKSGLNHRYKTQSERGGRPEWKWLPDHFGEDIELPLVRSPDNYQIVVVGGDAYKSAVVVGGNKTVTRLIEE